MKKMFTKQFLLSVLMIVFLSVNATSQNRKSSVTESVITSKEKEDKTSLNKFWQLEDWKFQKTGVEKTHSVNSPKLI